MKSEIKCPTCGEVIGEIEKPVITDEDIQQYVAMFMCSQGHVAVINQPVEE